MRQIPGVFQIRFSSFWLSDHENKVTTKKTKKKPGQQYTKPYLLFYFNNLRSFHLSKMREWIVYKFYLIKKIICLYWVKGMYLNMISEPKWTESDLKNSLDLSHLGSIWPALGPNVIFVAWLTNKWTRLVANVKLWYFLHHFLKSQLVTYGTNLIQVDSLELEVTYLQKFLCEMPPIFIFRTLYKILNKYFTYSGADLCKNCGFCDKSTQFGIKEAHYILIKFRYSTKLKFFLALKI